MFKECMDLSCGVGVTLRVREKRRGGREGGWEQGEASKRGEGKRRGIRKVSGREREKGKGRWKGRNL